MASNKAEARSGTKRVSRADLLSGAITVAAILLFVGIGSSVLSSSFRYMFGSGVGTDPTLVIALLLNIALILFGWRRHRELAQEVTVRTAAEERAQVLASKDPLTGFLNRRSLAEEGGAMFARASARGKAMALLMLDLDHFKTVNDMHGHATGDALLQAVALEIAEAMPGVALTARLGGDEFACAFLFDSGNPATVERIAERLVSRMAQPFQAEGLQLHISASLGLARSDFDCPSIDALMRAADIAMYAAKNSGRNRFAWFGRSMERELQARNDLEMGLRSAIPRGEIVPYFEQQIDLGTGRLTGFEMLARWEHPIRGLIVPDTFIPIAEETGMIADLSLSLMRQAFLAARDWDAALSLSVNISPWQLRDAWLSQKIIKVLTETGFPAHRLEIEITETALFDNLALTQSIVGSLKNQGIRLALDDFGTGYSSIAHLRALPFDCIKIDKSFIRSLNEDTESAAIVTAITRVGDSLGLPITAEGIEDVHIEERLRTLGCLKGQGYMYGRPTSIANTRRLLAERRLLQPAGGGERGCGRAAVGGGSALFCSSPSRKSGRGLRWTSPRPTPRRPRMSGPQIISLGCRLNIAESEAIRALLGERDMVVVNSCAVTNGAVAETRKAIRRARADRPGAQVIVTGCAAQIDPQGFAAMPEVDRVIGNTEKLLPAAWNGTERIDVGDIMQARDTAPHLASAFSSHARAFVEVQNGCDHRCTFCVIPYGRGNSRSVPAGVVIERIAALVANERREVVLTGVDLTSYGADLPGAPSLGSLVERILRHVPALERLRLSSLDGVEIDARLFALLTQEPRVMPHVHLSLQAGSDLILKRMKRRHSRADSVRLVERLKAARPDIAIGADLIAGFPTEDDAGAAETLALIDDCDIVHAHIFPYSERDGTPAARMPQVPVAARKARAAALRAAAARRRAAWLEGLVGTTQAVLVERPGDRGHAGNFATVRWHCPLPVRPEPVEGLLAAHDPLAESCASTGSARTEIGVVRPVRIAASDGVTLTGTPA